MPALRRALLIVCLLGSAACAAPAPGLRAPAAGFVLAALGEAEGASPVPVTPAGGTPATGTPAGEAAGETPAAPATGLPYPTPTPAAPNAGNSRGGGGSRPAPTPTPTPTPAPGFGLAPVDGGWSDPAATETAVVGP